MRTRHPWATDETLDSTVYPRLVPWDGVQGPRQGSTSKVPIMYRRSNGICEECHEGQFVIFPGTGLRLRPIYDYQSGEGFSQSITSDCLSRLEGGEHTGFSEDIIREVAGMMFDGELASTDPAPVPMFLTICNSWGRDSMLETQSGRPITSLILLSDSLDLADVLLSNGSQPRRREESAGGT